MDNAEAREVLARELTRYRQRSYSDLRSLLDTRDVFERTGKSGAVYQLAIEAVWDDHPGGSLRIMGAIDDGGWRAIVPLNDSFIIAPNGSFVGE